MSKPLKRNVRPALFEQAAKLIRAINDLPEGRLLERRALALKLELLYKNEKSLKKHVFSIVGPKKSDEA